MQIIYYHSALLCLIGCLEVISSSEVFSTCTDSHFNGIFKQLILFFFQHYMGQHLLQSSLLVRFFSFRCRELSWWFLQIVFSLMTGWFCMRALSSCSPLHSYELKEPSIITQSSTDTRSRGHALMVPWLWKVSFEKSYERFSRKCPS